MLTADDMKTMLRAHYQAPYKPMAGLFATEIGAPTGGRTADAIWAPLTTAGGDGLIGHEIKVSRADLLTELADPTKAEAWSQHCREWWLVVSDPTMCDGLTTPETWGIMTPPSGRRKRSMTVVRPAAINRAANDALGWRRVTAWYAFKENERQREHETTVDSLTARICELENQVDAAENPVEPLTAQQERILAIVERVERLHTANGGGYFRVDPQLIADTIHNHKQLAELNRELENSIDYYQHDLTRLLKKVKKLDKKRSQT